MKVLVMSCLLVHLKELLTPHCFICIVPIFSDCANVLIYSDCRGMTLQSSYFCCLIACVLTFDLISSIISSRVSNLNQIIG